MKKLLLFLIPVLALLTACQTGIDQIIPSLRPVPKVFYASIEETQPAGIDTKVYADAQMRVLWNADDRISIFNMKDANLQYCFQGEDGDNAGEFTIVGSNASGSDVPHIYAVYPYSAGTAVNAAGTISLMLPDVQVYKANSFGIGANTMVSVTDDVNLKFKNLGGYLSLKLYGDDIEVKSISLRGNNGEKIAGAATVTADVLGAPVTVMGDAATGTITLDCGKGVSLHASEADYIEFWMVVPPTSFSGGFTITVTDIRGGTYSKSTTKPFEISRNTLSRMAPLEVTPDYTNSKAVFEDANFKNFCLGKFDDNKDGEIQMEEALPVKSISVSTDEIESLEGISFFANLEELICRGSEVQIPTKSSEGTMFVGKLKNLDLSHNKKLVRLDCSGNKIENLDLSNNGQLEELNCSGNNIEILDVSNNQALQVVQCSDNPMTMFNVSEGQVIPTVEIPEETSVVCGWVAPEQGNNEIWYTSTNGEIVNPAYPDRFNTALKSNTYENGRGIMRFEDALTTIGDAAFWGCNFKTILLPGSLVMIDEQAFGACRSLKTVNIPESVENIGSYAAFVYCDSLASFTGKFATEDHRSLVVNGVMVGFAPFGLTQYTIDKSVKEIGSVFFYCRSLTSINIPNGIKTINYEAFEGCTGLTQLVLPSSLETIRNHAFRDCEGLSSMKIPDKVNYIGEGCFDGCSSLASFSGKYASDDGRYLLKDNTILAFALSGCQHLFIPEGITETCPIQGFNGLKSIVFPSTITTFGQVSYCNSLDSLVINVVTPPTSINRSWWSTSTPWLFAGTNDCPIYVPATSVEAYKEAEIWKDYADRIRAIPGEQPDDEIWYTTIDGVVAVLRTTEGFGASFVSNKYADGRGVIKFDGPVTGTGNLGSDPFMGTKINSISLPASAVNIQCGFEGCQYLSSIHFPSHLDYVPGHLIANNYLIQELYFPETDDIAGNWGNGPIAFNPNLGKVTGPYATSDLRSLIKNGKLFAHAGAGFSSYAVPNGVKVIGPEAFAGYKNLLEITIPGSVDTIGYLSFCRCTGLTQIDLPESIKYIDNSAFSGCTGLVTFHVPANAEIGGTVFDGCTSLESFTGRYASEDHRLLIKNNAVYAIAPAGLSAYSIPEGVTDIDSGFGNSSNLQLESLELPTSLEFIRFLYGNRLKTLVCKAVTPPVVSYAHSLKMSNIEAIYVPEESVEAYKAAQYWSAFADCIQPIVESQPNNEIWYTSTNGAVVVPNKTDAFGVNIVSNTYEDGLGILEFDGPVQEVGLDAFFRCSKLQTILLPEGLVSVGTFAFEECDNLTSVSFPSTLKSLSQCAFFGCTSLTTVDIPESVTTISSLGVFAGCSSLVSFTGKYASVDGRSLIVDNTLKAIAASGMSAYRVPDNVSTVPSMVIACYPDLKKLVYPATATTIGQVYDCPGLDSVVFEAATPPSISQGGYFGSEPLRLFLNSDNCKIYVPATSVEAYKSAAYWSDYADRIQPIDGGQPNNEIWYTSTDGKVVTPRESDAFGADIVSNTYANGKGVISFSADVTQIGDQAFFYCQTLQSILLPETVNAIGIQAFAYCNAMQSIAIPENADSFGFLCFSPCKSLASITGKYASQDGRCLIVDNKLVAFAPAGLTTYVVDDAISVLGQGSFMDCTNLLSITLPSRLTQIESLAFYGCTALTSITLPETLLTIGAQAFDGCSSISTFHVPQSVNTIKDGVFNGCAELASFTGKFASADGRFLITYNEAIAIAPSGMTKCVFPEGVKVIRPYTIWKNSLLNEIVLPASLTYINISAITECKNLSSIVLLGTTPPGATNNSFFSNTNNCPIYVPAASVEAYKSAQYWSAYAERILPMGDMQVAVDLGLPSKTKWASFNLGATSNEQSGLFFAWGETSPKTSFSWTNYQFGSSSSLTKYCASDGLTTLEAQDDAATAYLGSNWRMPTHEEQEELHNYCTFTKTTVNGVVGYLVTSQENGNSIFLPIAGDDGDEESSYYWSSSRSTDEKFAHSFGVMNEGASYTHAGYGNIRYSGHVIRAVCK